MPEMGCFVFPFFGLSSPRSLLSDTAEEFLFAGQIKVNHAEMSLRSNVWGSFVVRSFYGCGKNVEI